MTDVNELLREARNVLERELHAHGHSHWDATMQHGAGCPMCIAQRETGGWDMLHRIDAHLAQPEAAEPTVNIADHLFIEQRGDGIWLVCVEKVHESMHEAQSACKKWRETLISQAKPALNIKAMVDRFLGWKLPKDFGPDCGIAFARIVNGKDRWEIDWWPTGTNLLTADQARQMFEYALNATGQPEAHFDKCPEGKVCVATTTGCRPGQCFYRRATFHHGGSFSLPPAQPEAAEPVDKLVTMTITIDRNKKAESDVQTHDNSFADVYSGLMEVKREIERVMVERQKCPYFPKSADEAKMKIIRAAKPEAAEPCCGEYLTCQRPCTPRGRELEHQRLLEAAPPAQPEAAPVAQEPVAWLMEWTDSYGCPRRESHTFNAIADYKARYADAKVTALYANPAPVAAHALAPVTFEHDLKVWPEFWPALESGEKTFEVRFDDRAFRVGEGLLLREWTKAGYTGRQMRRTITYILAGKPWLADNYVIMALRGEPR